MSKIINCKSCSKEISSSAKICPNCGAKNKKPFYKTAWFWIVVVIVLIIGFGSSSSSDDSSVSKNAKTKETKAIEYTKINIDDLEKALEDNAAAAKDDYNGKYLEISGRLGVIDSDLKYISLLSSSNEWDFVGVHCTIKNKETKNVVKSLKVDQDIVVKGKITDVGEVLGYYLDIDEIIPD